VNTMAKLQQYKGTQLNTSLEGADGHRLITLLIDGALERLIAAKTLDQTQMTVRGELVGKAISIIEYLRVSLDPGADLTFSEQLGGLYSYMEVQLLDVTMKQKIENLDETIRLLQEVRTGWTGIPKEYRAE